MTTPEERAAWLRFKAGMLRFGAASLDLAAGTVLATEEIRRFGDTLRRSYEAAFLELVVRYDEPASPLPRPWKIARPRRLR